MIINPNNDLNTSAQSRGKTGDKAPIAPDHKQHSSSAENVSSPDKVQLSAEAQQLASLENKIHASEGFDSAKVEAIKQKIADGEYSINSERIAAKMLQYDALL